MRSEHPAKGANPERPKGAEGSLFASGKDWFWNLGRLDLPETPGFVSGGLLIRGHQQVQKPDDLGLLALPA